MPVVRLQMAAAHGKAEEMPEMLEQELAKEKEQAIDEEGNPTEKA